MVTQFTEPSRNTRDRSSVVRGMQRHLPLRSLAPLVVTLVALLLMSACGGGSSDAAADEDRAPTTTSPPTTSTTEPDPEPEPADPITVDWTGRTVDPASVDGWSLAFCEGDGPFVCVTRNGRTVGAVELLSYDRRAALDEFDGDLRAWAEDHERVIAEDRAEGCGADYRLTAEEPADAIVAGRQGLRVVLTGGTGDDVTERNVAYVVVRDDDFFLVGANAYDPDGCIGTEGSDWTTDDLVAFEDVLAAMAAGSRLPAAAGPGETPAEPQEETTSGSVTVDPSGTAVLDEAEVLSGAEATEAARRAGVIGPDEKLENDVFVHDPDDATRTLRVTARTAVQLYDCAAGCELRPVETAAFLAGSVRPFGGDNAVFTVRTVGDEITALEEIYLP